MNGPGNKLRDEIYTRLGITYEEVRDLPQITHEIRAIVRYLRARNRPSNPYYYLAASDSPDAQSVLSFYRKTHVNAHYGGVPIEAYCAAAKVSPSRILEIIAATAIRLGAQASSIVAATAMPAVVHKSVEMALTDEGIEDRILLSRATGFLPTPKGAQTNIQVTQNASAQAAAAALPPAIAPSPESTIRRVVDRFNQNRALPPTSAVPFPEPSGELAREPVSVELVIEESDEDEELD